MPESLVINLVAESTIPFQYLKGHYLRRLFLALVSAVDVNLGQSLQAHKYRSFALSPLQIMSQPPPVSTRNLKFLLPRQQLVPFQYKNGSSIPAGCHCWWRVSLLDDALFAQVSARLKQAAVRKPWYLGPARLNITNFVPVNSHDWASHNSYQQLYQQASETHQRLAFQLLTPAIFRQGKHSSPLPSCDALFQGLRRGWNRYSGLVFAPDTITPITAQAFNLRTVNIGNRSATMVGCLGDVTFHIADNTDPLIIKRINALASFSRYCGVGDKTELGLGMVRVVTVTK